MLETSATTSDYDNLLQEYLDNTLGIIVRPSPWAGAGKLPYFLQDAFEVRELTLLGHLILLAIDRQAHRPALAQLRTQLDRLRSLAGLPVVYVVRALASYERRHLIEQKVPFVVPGNQLYLPDLGIDLRQYFRQRSQRPETALSPATQAVLITHLLRNPAQDLWQPAEVAAELGYTAMTLSRVVKELTATGIATLHAAGRKRQLRITASPAETWEHAKPLLCSPVKRSVWVQPVAGLQPPHVRWAGQSALARHSLLAEPHWPVYALSPVQWKAAKSNGAVALVEPLHGSCEYQLWKYSSTLVPDSATVDLLSLTLSLQDETDERVQLAISQLEEQLPW
jgi:DNA-binding MarR family transcriptional regulator